MLGSNIGLVRDLDALVARCQRPATIVSDNSTQMTSRAVLDWHYRSGVEWRYLEPGKPIQNAHAESFNGRIHNECLN